ncbi:golgin candidate 2-like [Pistacia vera]|uniref:golgin candidate 2-like n=1 Tax=Pistacia vera TaxID=55513 RepID=UPI0012639817|nr:golgin candidate 2-like [Pistacia vera]
MEAVSRLLEENKSMSSSSSRDLESGAWELSQSKLGPLFEDKIRSGRRHIGSLVLQLDSIFLAGMVSEAKSNRKNMVFGLPCMPSLLGRLHSNVTFKHIK